MRRDLSYDFKILFVQSNYLQSGLVVAQITQSLWSAERWSRNGGKRVGDLQGTRLKMTVKFQTPFMHHLPWYMRIWLTAHQPHRLSLSAGCGNSSALSAGVHWANIGFLHLLSVCAWLQHAFQSTQMQKHTHMSGYTRAHAHTVEEITEV